jgi:anaerobic C4-dicarboxylate transporter
MASESAADDLANAVVTAAGPAAYLAAGTPSAPAPIATPWLIMLSTAGIALLIAKGSAADPALVTVAFGAGTVMCCAALGSSWLRQCREGISEPGS